MFDPMHIKSLVSNAVYNEICNIMADTLAGKQGYYCYNNTESYAFEDGSYIRIDHWTNCITVWCANDDPFNYQTASFSIMEQGS